MIDLIYGLPGTGKTKYVSERIIKDIEDGKKVLLIVPEQQTVEAERSMLKLLKPSAQLSFEALNFSRLANKLFRIYGGLSYSYATNGMKNLFMKRTLIELIPHLKEYALKAVGDSSMPALMLSQINEFKVNGISATKLDRISSNLEDGHPLKNKLADFALIYSAYEGMFSSAYEDSSEDLEKLYSDILCKHRFFNGYNVYVDAFSSFTACELKIMEKIFSQADNVAVTLPCEGATDSSIHLHSVNEASKKLLNAAGKDANIITFKTPYRAKTEELKRIQASLWDFSTDPKKLPTIASEGSVSIIKCADEYAEAEAAANIILKLLGEGYRRSEIAVVAGNMDSYRGIIDSAFEKAGIPHFMSERENLINEPLISMILSAFAIKQRNWRSEDVIAYLKTGLTDFTPNEVDVFELYVSTWRINGNRFFDEEWTMNPDGFTAPMTLRGTLIRECANRVKKALTDSLSAFFTRLNAATSVSQLCEATYGFFKENRLSEKLMARAEAMYSADDRKGALECAGTHKAFIKVLSDVASAMGDKEMSVEEFASSLKLVFANTDVGTIPTAADEVILGSASMLRASNIKCAVLIGVCDGVFPASTSDCGFFSDNEKLQLKELEIELESNTARQNSEELLYAYRAMTLPSDKLYLIYNTGSGSSGSRKPSLAVTRTEALLPNVKTLSYESLSDASKIYSKQLAFEALKRIGDSKAHTALKEIFNNDPKYSALLKRTEIPITDADCKVSEDTAKAVFGDTLRLSQSKLEKYVKCHFSYYCTYALDLRESKTASFKYNDSGTFIHHVLEVFVRSTVDEKGFNPNLTDTEIGNIVSTETDRYLSDLFGDKQTPSKRLLHLFDRLKRLTFIIAIDLYNEIRAGKFIPAFFEMGIGKGANRIIPAYRLTLNDGSVILFEGIVDRVDIYKCGKEVFVKVVDYKTGSKTFRLSDIKDGLNIQMLMYLFAICNSKDFISAVGCSSDTELKPAGVAYISTNVSPQKSNRSISENELIKKISESFTREGLLLDDEEVLLAMNKDLNKNYLMGAARPKPTKSNPDPNQPLKGNALTSAEAFGDIEKEITDVLTSISAEIRNGNASITPMEKENPCQYCGMKQFCRIDPSYRSSCDEDGEEE